VDTLIEKAKAFCEQDPAAKVNQAIGLMIKP
jgi:hypothetical protein